MTKFEEEFEHELDYFIERELSLDEKLSFGARDVLVKFFSGWHSPEHIEKEIQMKLLKLQQQALPVVPECVAEWIEKDKNYGRSVYDGLHRLDYEAGEIAPREVAKWVFDNKENLNLFTRAWLDGYTVNKPQLFYLKHIDMSKRDSDSDWYLIKDDEGLDHEWEFRGEMPEEDRFKFTQAEIDSMETGSYEQIKVAE